MLTTLYIVISLLNYVFDTYPMYKLIKEAPEYRRMNTGGKGFRKFDVIMFYVATANLAVCFVLLMLKCVGIVEWW